MEAVRSEIHKEIIELSKDGNSRAQYRLYQLYAKAMFNVCMRMMHNREEAEDLLQDSFTDAFMKLGSFRYESSFGSWLKRIVINHCLNRIGKREIALSFPGEVPESDDGAGNGTDDEEISYSVGRIYGALEELPEGYRVIFSLYALEGYDHREISEILDISESTSKSQYSRARQKIREIIKAKSHERQA